MREGNGMEWNNNKRMERNILSKGKEWKRMEWNRIELSNLDWMF